MHVVDHEPHVWYLFEREEQLLLDVNCNHSAAGYSVLIPLSSEEATDYACDGRACLNRLARAVQDGGPGRGHQLRDVSKTYSKECAQALRDWRASEIRP